MSVFYQTLSILLAASSWIEWYVADEPITSIILVVLFLFSMLVLLAQCRRDQVFINNPVRVLVNNAEKVNHD